MDALSRYVFHIAGRRLVVAEYEATKARLLDAIRAGGEFVDLGSLELFVGPASTIVIEPVDSDGQNETAPVAGAGGWEAAFYVGELDGWDG
ncbi:hypothetical protein ACRAWC_08965 [Leifsonia sp. L25]|uniref:hypothetical protein n=1 Tax=Actinomycetes TaxID=1760 RepID=UPI003D69C52B